MRAWFESLEERERLFVVAAAIVLAIALFYLAIWMPLDRGQRNLATSIETWRESLAELRVLKPVIGKTGPRRNAPADVGESLVVIVDNTLRERGLYNSLQRSQPTTTNGIRVEFENVAFDDLVLWLGDLSSSYGLQVQSASFSAASEQNDGRVNSSLTLER